MKNYFPLIKPSTQKRQLKNIKKLLKFQREFFRFISLVDISEGPNSCWPWKGSTNSHGYGEVKLAGERITTHVFMWIIFNQDNLSYLLSEENVSILQSLHILHSCDNPPCVNPSHLRCGTQAMNTQDLMERGPSPFTDSSFTYPFPSLTKKLSLIRKESGSNSRQKRHHISDIGSWTEGEMDFIIEMLRSKYCGGGKKWMV